MLRSDGPQLCGEKALMSSLKLKVSLSGHAMSFSRDQPLPELLCVLG